MDAEQEDVALVVTSSNCAIDVNKLTGRERSRIGFDRDDTTDGAAAEDQRRRVGMFARAVVDLAHVRDNACCENSDDGAARCGLWSGQLLYNWRLRVDLLNESTVGWRESSA